MYRFFVLPEDIEGNIATIKGSDVNHIKNVLRLNEGNNIIIFDGTGKQYELSIEYVRDEVRGRIINRQEIKDKVPVKIILLQGIPKSSKMDFVIQKCTEVGVNKIIPLITERTILKLNAKKLIEKQKRWQRIAKSSAQQSYGIEVPQIDEPVALFEALEKVDKETLNLIAWESETDNSLKNILRKNYSLTKRTALQISIFVGPEGGFSHQEVEQARLKGVIPVSLGSRILRTETAGLAIAIMILYEMSALG